MVVTIYSIFHTLNGPLRCYILQIHANHPKSYQCSHCSTKWYTDFSQFFWDKEFVFVLSSSFHERTGVFSGSHISLWLFYLLPFSFPPSLPQHPHLVALLILWWPALCFQLLSLSLPASPPFSLYCNHNHRRAFCPLILRGEVSTFVYNGKEGKELLIPPTQPLNSKSPPGQGNLFLTASKRLHCQVP